MKHTSGPWTISIILKSITIKSDNMPLWKQCWPKTSSKGSIYVCDFSTPESPLIEGYDEAGAKLLYETNLANAHLIAAAPVLLRVLKDVQTKLCEYCPQYVGNDEGQVGDHTDECLDAMEVIAKAEGK